MSKKFPLDDFDNLPAHGGRHRIRRTGLDRVREFLRIMILAVVVAGVGFFGLTWADSSNIFQGSVPKPTAVADATKGYSITVLDATETAGTAGKLGHKILDAGYTIVTTDNAAKKQAKTVIYYSNVDYKATAQALTAIVGKFPLKLSTAYSDAITVVLGADYQK
jgi:LytR cell envelope-related transcriptional attenuator